MQPVVVAAHGERAERHQPVGGARGVERAVERVAEVEERRRPAGPRVGEHGVERPRVAVDVGDDRDRHSGKSGRSRSGSRSSSPSAHSRTSSGSDSTASVRCATASSSRPSLRLEAREVVEQRRVAGLGGEPVVHQRDALLPLLRVDVRLGAEAPLPGETARSPRRACRRRRGSSCRPPPRPRSGGCAGSGRKTSVPAGASSGSPSSSKRARPASTTYISSWSLPSSVWSSITSSPASPE